MQRIVRNFFLLLLAGLLIMPAYSQRELPLINPSFEVDKPRGNETPSDWIDCGYGSGGTVDIHSSGTNYFDVRSEAADGEQYIGLVAGSDYSWDGLGQELTFPLEPGRVHFFSLQAKKSSFYASRNARNSSRVNANGPLVLFLWGSNAPAEQDQLLGWSSVMEFEDWTTLSFRFVPDTAYQFIWFEAGYADNTAEPYDGNVLIDDLSSIQVWDDTMRYQPICMDDRLYGWLDRKNLTDSTLAETIRREIGLAAENGDLSVISQRDLHQFWLTEFLYNQLNTIGLRAFILQRSGYELIVFQDALAYLDCTEEAAILRRGIELHLKAGQETITAEEIAEFDALDERWRQTERIRAHQATFTAEYRDLLIEQLNDCR